MADPPTKPRQSAAEERALLEELFAHAPVAFQILNAEGRSVLVNQAFRDLYGAEPPPEYNVFEDAALEKQGFLAHVRRAFAGEKVRADPHIVDKVGLEVTLFPLRDAKGDVLHIALCTRDSSSVLELGKAMRAYAHDLNNLLSVILSYSELLLSELGPEAEIATELGEIRKAGMRVAELAGKMLAMGRASGG
jgi:signal transduction histidine kinase